MNKQGGLGVTIVVALILFLIGMSTVNIITPEVTQAKTDLDCTNTSITDGTKINCLFVDWVVPYWFIIILAAAGGAIAGRFL